ncbi:unnamed protein product [Prunus armeniaca]
MDNKCPTIKSRHEKRKAHVPLLAMKTLADFFEMDNLRPKLLISKQAIVNLGEEYLPKASYLGWTGCICAALNCQQLQLLSFSCKSIPRAEVAGLEDY